MRKFLIIALGLIVLFGCTGHKNVKGPCLRDYYFPYSKFINKHIYYYVNANDTSDRSTWIMQTKVDNGDTLFLTEIQDSKNRTTESLIEKIDENSSQILKYTLFNYDNKGNSISRECKVINSFILKWDQRLNESVIWKINYLDFSSPITNEFSKSRTLNQVDTENQTILFLDKFHYAMLGTNVSYDWSAESQYQKGKGLVKYKINLPSGKIRDLRLINIK